MQRNYTHHIRSKLHKESRKCTDEFRNSNAGTLMHPDGPSNNKNAFLVKRRDTLIVFKKNQELSCLIVFDETSKEHVIQE